MVDAVEQMVYAGEVPWHGLGKKVSNDLTPAQIQKEAGADFTVEKVPSFYTYFNDTNQTGWSTLIRDRDSKNLGQVPNDWNVVQNDQAFEFFNGWVAQGEMIMETAGVLDGGRIVWALAKLKDGTFDLFGGKDRIDPYFLFTNPHRYGWSTSVSLSIIRVVCLNTLVASLGSTTKDKIIRVSHRNVFNADEVKLTLGVAADKIQKYKKAAEFLASKQAPKENVVEYFQRIFPALSKTKPVSKAAQICIDNLEKQPGSEFASGTWWNAYNSTSFYTDHIASKTVDTRLTNAWYGTVRSLKINALRLATEMASA